MIFFEIISNSLIKLLDKDIKVHLKKKFDNLDFVSKVKNDLLSIRYLFIIICINVLSLKLSSN